MEFLSSINSFGTVPLLILIVVIFILLFKEVKKENQALSRSFDKHKEYVDAAIKEYKETTDRQIEVQNKQLEKMEERLRSVETDYAEKTYIQEQMSGWRTEIRRIDEKLDRVLLSEAGRKVT